MPRDPASSAVRADPDEATAAMIAILTVAALVLRAAEHRHGGMRQTLRWFGSLAALAGGAASEAGAIRSRGA